MGRYVGPSEKSEERIVLWRHVPRDPQALLMAVGGRVRGAMLRHAIGSALPCLLDTVSPGWLAKYLWRSGGTSSNSTRSIHPSIQEGTTRPERSRNLASGRSMPRISRGFWRDKSKLFIPSGNELGDVHTSGAGRACLILIYLVSP